MAASDEDKYFGQRFTMIAQLEQVANDILTLYSEQNKARKHRKKGSKNPIDIDSVKPVVTLNETNGYCLLLSVSVEQCLTFGLGKKFFRTTQITLYDAIVGCSHAAGPINTAFDYICKDTQTRDLSENGKARAWIRHLLNEKKLSDIIYPLIDKNRDKSCFEAWAILKNNEKNTLKAMIEKLEKRVDFEFTFNDGERLQNDALFDHFATNMDMVRVKHSVPRVWKEEEEEEEEEIVDQDDIMTEQVTALSISQDEQIEPPKTSTSSTVTASPDGGVSPRAGGKKGGKKRKRRKGKKKQQKMKDIRDDNQLSHAQQMQDSNTSAGLASETISTVSTSLSFDSSNLPETREEKEKDDDKEEHDDSREQKQDTSNKSSPPPPTDHIHMSHDTPKSSQQLFEAETVTVSKQVSKQPNPNQEYHYHESGVSASIMAKLQKLDLKNMDENEQVFQVSSPSDATWRLQTQTTEGDDIVSDYISNVYSKEHNPTQRKWFQDENEIKTEADKFEAELDEDDDTDDIANPTNTQSHTDGNKYEVSPAPPLEDMAEVMGHIGGDTDLPEMNMDSDDDDDLDDDDAIPDPHLAKIENLIEEIHKDQDDQPETIPEHEPLESDDAPRPKEEYGPEFQTFIHHVSHKTAPAAAPTPPTAAPTTTAPHQPPAMKSKASPSGFSRKLDAYCSDDYFGNNNYERDVRKQQQDVELKKIWQNEAAVMRGEYRIVNRSDIIPSTGVILFTNKVYTNKTVAEIWREQSGKCFTCGEKLESYLVARLCNYTLRVYCQLCLDGTQFATVPSKIVSQLDTRDYLVSTNSLAYLEQMFNVPTIPLSQINLNLLKHTSSDNGGASAATDNAATSANANPKAVRDYFESCYEQLNGLGAMLKLFSQINVYYKQCPNNNKLNKILGSRGYLLEAYDTDRNVFGTMFGLVPSSTTAASSSSAAAHSKSAPENESKNSEATTKDIIFGLVSMRDILELLPAYPKEGGRFMPPKESNMLRRLDLARMEFAKHIRKHCKVCETLTYGNVDFLNALGSC